MERTVMLQAYKLRYSGIRKYFSIICKTVIRSIVCKEKKLIDSIESFICDTLDKKNKLNCITPSGRVALNRIFSMPEIHTIILPEYICNVVPMAAGEKTILYYTVDENYKTKIQEVIELIADRADCCVLFSSYLNREVDIAEIMHQIRSKNKTCTIIFDECQNIQSLMKLPALDEKTFAVYSFNNKMSYGFMGGAIVQGINNPTSKFVFQHACFSDNMHGISTVIRSGFRDVIYAMKGLFCIPDDPEISQGRGIYSTQYESILKISVASASLIKDNWGWYISCLQANRILLDQLNNEGEISVIPGLCDTYMPFIPIRNDKTLYGKCPLKGRYGGLINKTDNRNINFVLHNSMKLEIRKWKK